MTTGNVEPVRQGAPALKPASVNEVAASLAAQYRHLIARDQVVELRALGVQQGSYRPFVSAGFFDHDHLLHMAKAALNVTRFAKGVYFTLNPLNPDLLARRTNRICYAGDGELAKDKDVLRRQWMLVDADPIRDPLISATDGEKIEAYQVIQDVRAFLRSRSWPDPILADSGNGYHLLYHIDMPSNDGGQVKRILEALASRFDTDRVKIDRSVFNASRICKLPGTLARKGDSTPTRPHRRAAIMEVPQ
jgi:hypothetical protein